jgi:hypothetical protein
MLSLASSRGATMKKTEKPKLVGFAGMIWNDLFDIYDII